MSSSELSELSGQELRALVDRAGGLDQVRRILSGEVRIEIIAAAPSSPSERVVTMQHGLAFEERISRGRYGWRHAGLTADLFAAASARAGEYGQRLFHFARSISSEEAIRLIGAAGYEPAQVDDVLAFAEHFPEVQRRHPVVGLGSIVEVDQKLSVPALWFDGERRTLDAIWYDGDWHRNYRFLGIRRPPGG